ncbi:unnamed protein product [Polarella glacialis]|uniref:Uncharacterized protein n=1 Tax=Polarella glacialis TaxID=89957 RepID=A0A813G120_POLGL|nr:unnamed protein product [Polarella glacialis]
MWSIRLLLVAVTCRLVAAKPPICWTTAVNGLALDCDDVPSSLEVRLRALFGVISSGDPFLGDGSSQPAAVRSAGSVPNSEMGDDIQEWAYFRGNCPEVSARIQNISYERCGTVGELPYDGYDTVLVKAVYSGKLSFAVTVGIASSDAALGEVARVVIANPTSGPSSGGTVMNITVKGLSNFSASQVPLVRCQFGSDHDAMSTVADWTPSSNFVRCRSPPLSRRLVSVPELDEPGATEAVSVLVHLTYYVFGQGWRRTDPLSFTYQPASITQEAEVPPRVRRVLPSLVRLPKLRRSGSAPVPLLEVELGDPIPRDYTQAAFYGSSGSRLVRAASAGMLRCRLSGGPVEVALDAALLKGTAGPTPLPGSEDWPRVLCLAKPSAVEAALASAGEGFVVESILEISVDGGQTWSGRADEATVTLVGPRVLQFQGVTPNVRFLGTTPSNVSLMGVGFSLLRSALTRGQGSGAVLECVWSPRSLHTRLRGKCRAPAFLSNDTAIICSAPPQECMRRRGPAGYEAAEVELRYGAPGAASKLVLSCGSAPSDCDEADKHSPYTVNCLHAAVPPPMVQALVAGYVLRSPLLEDRSDMEVTHGLAVPSTGGVLRLQVGGLPSAGVGSALRFFNIVCRFRHAASGLGPMATAAYIVEAVLEERHVVSCRAPDWNQSLAGGFGGNLTYRPEETWRWLLDLAVDGGYSGTFLPSPALEVRVSRASPAARATRRADQMPATGVQEEVLEAEGIPRGSTCWWSNHSGKDRHATDSEPLGESFSGRVPSLLYHRGDGTMVCDTSYWQQGNPTATSLAVASKQIHALDEHSPGLDILTATGLKIHVGGTGAGLPLPGGMPRNWSQPEKTWPEQDRQPVQNQVPQLWASVDGTAGGALPLGLNASDVPSVWCAKGFPWASPKWGVVEAGRNGTSCPAMGVDTYGVRDRPLSWIAWGSQQEGQAWPGTGASSLRWSSEAARSNEPTAESGGVAAPSGGIVYAFEIVPALLEPRRIPRAVTLVGHSFSLTEQWFCRWSPLDGVDLGSSPLATVPLAPAPVQRWNSSALECPLPDGLADLAAAATAGARWEVQAFCTGPPGLVSMPPLVVELLPVAPLQPLAGQPQEPEEADVFQDDAEMEDPKVLQPWALTKRVPRSS